MNTAKRNKIKFLNIYKKEYSFFKKLERLPKSLLLDFAEFSHLDVDFYKKNKKLLAKGIYIVLGGPVPSNFDKC